MERRIAGRTNRLNDSVRLEAQVHINRDLAAIRWRNAPCGGRGIVNFVASLQISGSLLLKTAYAVHILFNWQL